jgi:hypothetical protein
VNAAGSWSDDPSGARVSHPETAAPTADPVGARWTWFGHPSAPALSVALRHTDCALLNLRAATPCICGNRRLGQTDLRPTVCRACSPEDIKRVSRWVTHPSTEQR